MKKAMVYTLALAMLFTTMLAGCGNTSANGQNAPAATPMVTETLPATTTVVPDADEMLPDTNDGVVEDQDGIITESDNAGNNDTGSNNVAKTRVKTRVNVGSNTMNSSNKGVSGVKQTGK